jgi:hypothetical protein
MTVDIAALPIAAAVTEYDTNGVSQAPSASAEMSVTDANYTHARTHTQTPHIR